MSGEAVEVLVGRIGRPHGLRGEVTVDVRTDEPDRRYADGAILKAQPPRGAAGGPDRLTVTHTRWHQGVLLVTFAEVSGREEAEALRGTLLRVDLPAEERPEDPEEFYDHQLVGLRAVDQEGRDLGVLTAVVHGAAQDLLGVRTPDGRDTLVPFVAALVPEVDLAEGRVVIADRPGLVSPFPDEGDAR